MLNYRLLKYENERSTAKLLSNKSLKARVFKSRINISRVYPTTEGKPSSETQIVAIGVGAFPGQSFEKNLKGGWRRGNDLSGILQPIHRSYRVEAPK